MVSKRIFFAMLFLSMVGLLTSLTGTPARAAETVQVYCYVGDPTNNEFIGTADFVKPSQAASACDALYYDCEGHCTGCFKTADSDEVCVDPTGRVYTP